MGGDMDQDDTRQVVSAGRLAADLGLPLLWLEQEAQAGRLPSLRIDPGHGKSRYLFNRDAVLRCLARRAATGQAGESVR